MLNAQNSENIFLKYILIVLAALLASMFATKVGLIQGNFIGLGINHYLDQWTQAYRLSVPVSYLQSIMLVAHYLSCFQLLMALGLSLILSPSIIIIVVLLWFFKKDWLPNNDPFLKKLWSMQIIGIMFLSLMTIFFGLFIN